jgi:peptide/nickel transport system substrate-binding protein
MRVWRSFFALALTCALYGGAADARTFRYAVQGDLNSLDPYSLNEAFTLTTIGNVMEGLVRRGKDLKIVPALAERWEIVNPLKWRFYLRKGVKFHNGENFTADDVLFSLERARTPGSQIKTRIPEDMTAEKIDDYTVEFNLKTPNPILPSEWEGWLMFSKSWAEANGATQAQSARATSLSPFALKINGTGPFMVVSHEPGVRTVFKSNPNWWGKPEHNLSEVIMTTIRSDPTRVGALLSGEVDMIDPLPVQDIDRVRANSQTDALITPETRIIFFNMDQFRDELLYSNVKGKNPFRDIRVRKAVYQAIDADAIKTKVMRGMSVPAASLIPPILFERITELKRYPYDPAASRKLLSEAGYPDGFAVTLDCPNDRYVNDDSICQAAAAMLARVGIKVTLNLLPKARYFEKVTAVRKYDSSFNLMGWVSSSFDSWNVLKNVVGCRDANGKGGPFNLGGYCNKAVDELAAKILVESDIGARDEMIAQAFKMVNDDVGFIPLHQQSIIWGASKKIKVVQRADGNFRFAWVQKQD